MTNWKLASWALLVGLLVATSGASAQDPAGGVAAAPAAGGGSSGLALEFQGRYSLLSEVSFFNDTPRLLPPVAIGLRLLDGRLYVGLGLVFDSTRVKVCPAMGDCDTNADGNLFGVAPVVTYDILSRGAAHLYPMASLTFARNEVVTAGPNDDFAWGMNLGLGLRGDIGDAVSIGSEWGWGFVRASDDIGGASVHLMGHGFFGTVNLSARIGL